MMDWFERLSGFRESDYATTRGQLEVRGSRLHSRANGASHEIGGFELVSLHDLRERVKRGDRSAGKLKVCTMVGDVRALHRAPEYAGALFQVASQFNMLEMTGPEVTPDDGVTRYQDDRTQGPACAIAAGAATIYRNYFVPVDGGEGQTAARQIDGLAAIGATLSTALGQPVLQLWDMRNGYALCTQAGLDAITVHLEGHGEAQADDLRVQLRVGLHSDVEVSDAQGVDRPSVSQVFCSALPIAYTSVPAAHWKAFASLILQAAYEATLWAAVLNARRGVSNKVLLTSLGGGVFGNDPAWIHSAMRRALTLAAGFGIEVYLVSHGAPSRELIEMAEEFE